MNFLDFKLTQDQILLLSALGVILLIQILYYLLVVIQVSYKRKPKPKKQTQEPVSVIVCAKNEYHNLKQYLAVLLEQDYPEFEVVVVDDGSQDETQYLLKVYAEIYPHMKVVSMGQNVNFFSGKKYPLSIGIKSAKHDIVLLTDADCMPNSFSWISEMEAAFSEGVEVVLGYGGYATTELQTVVQDVEAEGEKVPVKRKSSFGLNAFIQYDTLCTASNYMGFALLGLPYMGVGRNLAYRKSMFFRHGGFISHYSIPSGDDDLFVNQVANNKNTKVVLDPQSFTFSEPKRTYRDWFRQKRRHLSSGKYYKLRDRMLLSIYPLSVICFYVLTLLAFFCCPWFFVLPILIVKIFVQIFCYMRASKALTIRKIFIFVPLMEVFFLIFNTIMFFSSLSSKRKIQWK